MSENEVLIICEEEEKRRKLYTVAILSQFVVLLVVECCVCNVRKEWGCEHGKAQSILETYVTCKSEAAGGRVYFADTRGRRK
jgi:hypothetical protein